jgi:hypothetical protein
MVMRRPAQITLLLLGGGAAAATAFAAFPTRRDECERAWREGWPNVEEVCRRSSSRSHSSSGRPWWSWSSYGYGSTTHAGDGHSTRGGFGGTASSHASFSGGG